MEMVFCGKPIVGTGSFKIQSGTITDEMRRSGERIYINGKPVRQTFEDGEYYCPDWGMRFVAKDGVITAEDGDVVVLKPGSFIRAMPIGGFKCFR